VAEAGSWFWTDFIKRESMLTSSSILRDVRRRTDLRPNLLDLVLEELKDLGFPCAIELEVPHLDLLVLAVAMDPTDTLFEAVSDSTGVHS